MEDDATLAAEALALVRTDQPLSEAVRHLALLRDFARAARAGRAGTDKAAEELSLDEKFSVWSDAVHLHERSGASRALERFPELVQQVREAYLRFRGGPGPMSPSRQWIWVQAVRLSLNAEALPLALVLINRTRCEAGFSDSDLS